MLQTSLLSVFSPGPTKAHGYLQERTCSRKRYSRRKKCIDCTALFANKFAHQSSWIPVGANLFAKALFQTQKMHRLRRPLREQVRPPKLMDTCRSELVRESVIPDAKNASTAPPSSRTSSPTKAHGYLQERTCSRKRYSRRKKCIDCTALFANKFAHQSSWIPAGANLFAKALFQTQKMHRLNRPLREQVRSHQSSWIPGRRPLRMAFGQNQRRTNARTGINEAL